jgi:DNA-directed RNA polymerase subunit RPC12/RpoP
VTRIDVCTACRRPFYVHVVGDDRSNLKESAELVCPNCGEVFTEQSRGVLLTSTMSAEAEWEVDVESFSVAIRTLH